MPHRSEFAASMKYLTYLKDPYKGRMIASILPTKTQQNTRRRISFLFVKFRSLEHRLQLRIRCAHRNRSIIFFWCAHYSSNLLFHPFDPSQQFNDRRVKSGSGMDLRVGRSTFWQMIDRERLLLIVRGGWPVWNKEEVGRRKDQFGKGLGTSRFV